MKPVAASSTSSVMPAVSLPVPTASKAELLSSMMEVFGVSPTASTSQFFSLQIKGWLDSSTPEQLAELGVILDVLGPLDGFDDDTDDPVVKRERTVIRNIMNETIQNRTNRVYTHDMLAVRSAFCSDYSRVHELPLGQGFTYFIGLISKDGHVLPPSERATDEELASGIRFAYELGVRLSDGSAMPTMGSTVESIDDRGDVKGLYASEYKSRELLELVMRNADRVGELIDLAETRKSCDPSLLRELLNSDTHRAMNPGWL
jgi:hypothetical protein